MHRVAILLMVSISATVIVGCSSDEDALDSAYDGGASNASGAHEYCYGSNDCSPGYYCDDYGQCVLLNGGDLDDSAQPADGGAAETVIPPEVELRVKTPAIGERFVYVALPDYDTVVRIDARNMGVRSFSVGRMPTVVRILPNQDTAVVLNRDSATLTIVRVDDAANEVLSTVNIVPGVNSLAIAPDGKHVIAYYNLHEESAVSAQKPLQDITLITLGSEEVEDTAIDLSVEFSPAAVHFASDGSKAFVVAERGISVIDFATVNAPQFIPGVSLTPDALHDATGPSEVLVTADGSLALLRVPGLSGVRVVNLSTEALTDLPLSAEPTDIDLTPDGTRALAVLRESNEIAVIDLPADIDDPTAIETIATGTYVVGQAEMTPDGTRAYLFSNAVTQEVLIELTMATAELKVIPLKKGVRAIMPAPDGKTAIVLHNHVSDGTPEPDSLEDTLDRSCGYSLVDQASGFVKLRTTPADLGQVAFSEDGLLAFLLLDPAHPADSGVRAMEAIDLRSFLVDRVDFASDPIAIGILGDGAQVCVTQNNALGRVTFVDAETHTARTLTGFALNSEIIE